MELALKAYYNLLDDCTEFPEWTRKIEEDIGQNIAFMTIAFDESVRDELVDRSELFKRFVSNQLSHIKSRSNSLLLLRDISSFISYKKPNK